MSAEEEGEDTCDNCANALSDCECCGECGQVDCECESCEECGAPSEELRVLRRVLQIRM